MRRRYSFPTFSPSYHPSQRAAGRPCARSLPEPRLPSGKDAYGQRMAQILKASSDTSSASARINPLIKIVAASSLDANGRSQMRPGEG